MARNSGSFHEAISYSNNFKLPLIFVIEDNSKSVNTPTKLVWGQKRKSIPQNCIYYKYKLSYPHHGIGKFINF